MTRPPVRSANPSFLHSDRVLARAAQPLVRFLHIEAAGGILLVVATVVALVWANSPWQDSYDVVLVDDDPASRSARTASRRTSPTSSTTC